MSAAAGLAAVQIGIGLVGSKMAKDSAEKAAARQGTLVALQRAEERRQKAIEFRMTLGGARLASFASGLQQTGSTLGYLGMLESEQLRQLDYMQKANVAEQNAIAAGAEGAGDSLLISGIASGITTGFGAYLDWRAGQIPPSTRSLNQLSTAPPPRDFAADALG